MMKDLRLKVSLFGKHQSSSEYLHLGVNSDFMRGVSKWIESGYEALLQSRTSKKSTKVHHFSFLNKGDDSVVIGSIKLNKDRMGREFPLVICVEVSPYSSFVGFEEFIDFSKTINKKILDIFAKECSLDELKTQLVELSGCDEVAQDSKNNIFALFMDEDFSRSSMFFRPLEVDDFMKMMG